MWSKSPDVYIYVHSVRVKGPNKPKEHMEINWYVSTLTEVFQSEENKFLQIYSHFILFWIRKTPVCLLYLVYA